MSQRFLDQMARFSTEKVDPQLPKQRCG
jgi:hypothetical protein